MSAEFPNDRLCPPEVRGYVAQMEELMQQPEYNHAGVPAQIAVDLMRAGVLQSFTQFESCMREVGSRVHLLTVPLDYYGDRFTTKYPVEREGEPEYSLFVAVNGAEEASRMLDELGISAADNLTRLERTGVLMMPEAQ